MDHSIHNIPVFKGKMILSRLVHGRINHKLFLFSCIVDYHDFRRCWVLDVESCR